MRLFKFVSSTNAVLNMATGLLKFTPVGELNDPSELTPVLDRSAVYESLQVLRRDGMTKDQFAWLQHQGTLLDILAPEEKVVSAPRTLEKANHMLKSCVYENLDYMESKLFATIEKIRSRVGILSLSQRYDSLPMWAHYANLAKGFVVVLENLKCSFSGDNTRSLNILRPVVYTDQFIGMTFDPSTQDRLFFSKLLDWSYEREWRVVTALNSCQRDGNLYLRKVDRNNITEVICGWRVCENDISLLTKELHRLNPDIKLTSAVLDRGMVRLTQSI